MVALAQAFVKIRPEVDRREFVAAGREAGRIAGDAAGDGMRGHVAGGLRDEVRAAEGPLTKEGERVGGSVGRSLSKGIGNGSRKASGDTSAFGTALALTTARATLFGSSIAAAAPGLIHLTAALLPAAGAVNVLPAGLLAGAAAMGTFKIATAGVGDAIQKGLTGTSAQAKKAMDAVPPSARVFARSIIDLKTQINGLKQAVAQRFFLPMQDDVKPLANLYLPLLRKRMADLAGPLGGLGEQFAESARRARVYGAVSNLFVNTRLAVINLRGAIDPLIAAMAMLVRSTAPFLPGLAQGFTNLAERVSVFVKEAARSGRIAQTFRDARATIGDLLGVLGNAGSILRSVFTAATAGGTGLLGNLRSLTGQAAAFLKTAEGMGALRAVFGTLAALGAALRTSLAAVLPAVARSLAAIGPAIAGLAAPAATLVTALAPLLPLAAGLAATVIVRLTPAIAALADWLARNTTLIKAVAAALGAAFVVVKTIAVVTKLWTAAQWLLNAALAANPIGLVVVAIGALVAGLVYAYQHSETFRKIVDAAWRGIAAAAKWAWETVIKPVVTAFVWYYTKIVGPAVMWLWRNVVEPAWHAITRIIQAAWVVIQIIFRAWWLYLTKILFPVLRFLWNNVVKPVFSGIAATISTVWNKGIKPIFQALGGFISKNVAPAFRAGVNAVAAAWDRIRAAAAAPVRFVIDTVINKGIIGGINWVASKVGVKDRIPPIRWNSGGVGSGVGGAAVSAARRISGGDGPGIGAGPGEGDGIGSLLAGPGKWLSNRIGLGRVAAKFGANPLTQALGGAVGKVKDYALTKIQTLIGELFGAGGGSVGAGGLRSGILSVLGALRGMFGNVPLISGLRRGAHTLSGALSYHASGRAIDIPAVYAWARYLVTTWGSRLKELITPWREFNMWHGRPHRYSQAIEAQHGVFGRNAHIHAALDDGGVRVLRPGYNVIPNWTGRPELVYGPAAAASSGGMSITVVNHGVIGSQGELDSWLASSVKRLRRDRRIP